VGCERSFGGLYGGSGSPKAGNGPFFNLPIVFPFGIFGKIDRKVVARNLMKTMVS
jgi:hypothetical protein